MKYSFSVRMGTIAAFSPARGTVLNITARLNSCILVMQSALRGQWWPEKSPPIPNVLADWAASQGQGYPTRHSCSAKWLGFLCSHDSFHATPHSPSPRLPLFIAVPFDFRLKSLVSFDEPIALTSCQCFRNTFHERLVLNRENKHIWALEIDLLTQVCATATIHRWQYKLILYVAVIHIFPVYHRWLVPDNTK